MLMMLPSDISRAKIWVARNTPERQTSMSVSHCSSVISVMEACATTPAELTRMSISPSASSASLLEVLDGFAVRTSQVTSVVSAPRSREPAAASATASADRLVETMSAPSRANASAMARPMPRVPPMTTAFFPRPSLRSRWCLP